MSNSDTALREFLEKIWYSPYRTVDRVMPELTALISEGYYPKEFTVWLVKNSLPNDNELLIRINLTKTEYMTYDEALNYWKENEQ